MYSFKKSLLALIGLLVLVVALAALMPLVSRGQGGDNNPLTRDTRKSFYLTKTLHNGSQALTACAAGYHMASLWEIFEPSNLRYNIDLGATTADSGSGPPSTSPGWIRTGFVASVASGGGVANCQAWTSANSGDAGSQVSLDSFWAGSTEATRISPWFPSSFVCSSAERVWCVQD